MECTKCGKLAPQEWDLQNTIEAWSGLDRRRTNVTRKNKGKNMKKKQFQKLLPKQWSSDTK
jgi:hypothetical protein